MSVWNHRVVSYPTTEQDRALGWGERVYCVEECFYDERCGPVVAVGAGCVQGDSLEGLAWVLDRMREALDKPVVNIEDVPTEEEGV